MKNVLVFLLSVLFVFSFTACGEPPVDEKLPSSDVSNHSSLPSAAPQTNTKISREEAINKALENAGLKREDVRDIEAELDLERGVTVWEVDFESKNTEYSYEINAQTGEILKSQTQPD